MRFAISLMLGAVASWYGHTLVQPAVQCYNSIENPLHFHSRHRPNEVFSQRYEAYQLGQIIPITADVALFRFLLHNQQDEFNLKPCSTLQACYKYGVQPMDQCQRFYTPVTANHTKSYFDLIVKRKQSGLMTKHLFGMHVGDSLLFRSVQFKIQYRPNRWKHVGMIAGGTGFTPMLQVIRHALTQPIDRCVKDKTKLSFLFCNRSQRHILLKGVFDELALNFPKRFRMFYTVDLPINQSKWLQSENHFIGHVTKEMIQQSMPTPTEQQKIIMLCGPDELLNHIAGTPLLALSTMSSGINIQPMGTDLNNLVGLGGLLGELGYSNQDIYRFQGGKKKGAAYYFFPHVYKPKISL